MTWELFFLALFFFLLTWFVCQEISVECFDQKANTSTLANLYFFSYHDFLAATLNFGSASHSRPNVLLCF